MPNKNPDKMDSKKLEFFKELLLKLKNDILRNIDTMNKETGGQMADSKDVSGHVMHMADVATDMYDREFALGLASNERELLQKIEAALKRIENGTYGLCLSTGKPISQARLKAIPYVEYCMEYQEKLEQDK
ncbi:MAG: TraR/DksA family transcriptional regulator [Candidatus Omnitrophica bacterium]|nr:TraR/DksA family transcriptional regulator [Candidatus Omnitrophota bacterium]